MNKIYTAVQIQELLRLALSSDHLTPADIADRVASGCMAVMQRLYRARPTHVHIFSGPHQCGAYALAVGRLLHEAGWATSIYLFYLQGKISEACQGEHQRAVSSGVDVEVVTNQFSTPRFAPTDMVIDGLFGSELVRPLEGGFVGLVQFLNKSGLSILSIDLPSGLFADDNSTNTSTQIIQAQHTIALETPRLAHLLEECAPYIGQWHVVPLGISKKVHQQVDAKYYTQSENVLGSALKSRAPHSTKYDYGRGLLVGGSHGRFGLLALSAEAALLAGCGELHVLLSEPGCHVLEVRVPQAILHTTDLQHTAGLPLMRSVEVIGIGVAMDAEMLSIDTLANIISTARVPLVLDGIAIELLAQRRELLQQLPEGSVLLISKQARRTLLGMQRGDLEYIESAQTLATRYDITIVLKGTHTAICRSSGNVYISTVGNASLATNGMGDVLFGLITGLIARGYEPLSASLIACYLQGTAADLYVSHGSVEGLTPMRLLSEIPLVLHQLYSTD